MFFAEIRVSAESTLFGPSAPASGDEVFFDDTATKRCRPGNARGRHGNRLSLGERSALKNLPADLERPSASQPRRVPLYCVKRLADTVENTAVPKTGRICQAFDTMQRDPPGSGAPLYWQSRNVWFVGSTVTLR